MDKTSIEQRLQAKREILEKWLKSNGFFSIKFSSDNHFVTANGNKNRIVVAITDESYEQNHDELIKFAQNNWRQAWNVSIDVVSEEVDFSVKFLGPQ